MEPIKKAISYFGSAKKLAEALGVSTQAVCFWRDGKRRIDADTIAAVERVTDGTVTREEFRPDTYLLTWPELKYRNSHNAVFDSSAQCNVTVPGVPMPCV